MAAGAFFLVLAVGSVVFLLIFLPLIGHRVSGRLTGGSGDQPHEPHRSALLSERDRLLNALLELDADHDLGKISAAEYAPMREELVHEAADIFKKLDEINLAPPITPAASAEQMEDDELEEWIAARKRELAGANENHSAGAAHLPVCLICGQPLLPDDRYCPYCGRKINQNE